MTNKSGKKYTMRVTVEVTEQNEDGSLSENTLAEHSKNLVVRNLDNEDVSLMQAPLIEVESAWNAVGIEGSEKSPTIPLEASK
jgi:hypothetical protein